MSDLFVPRSLEELALEWPEDLDHISASSLKMAVRCPEQWRQRYVLGKRLVPNAVLINGRANHSAIEFSMEQKVTSHVDLPVGDVLEFFNENFKEEVANEGGIGELEVRDGNKQLVTDKAEKTRLVHKVRNEGLSMVGTYHHNISPSVQPIAVEKKFELTPGTLPVKVIGRIDLLATNPGMTTPPVLIDRKTTGRMKTRPEPEWVVQAEIYQLVEPVAHYWHVSTTRETRTDLVQQPRARALAEKTLDHVVGEIGYYMRRYGPEEEWPVRGKLHPWACGYCGFRPDCWGWKEA